MNGGTWPLSGFVYAMENFGPLSHLSASMHALEQVIRESADACDYFDDGHPAGQMLIDSETEVIEGTLGVAFLVAQVHISWVLAQVEACTSSACWDSYGLPTATIGKHSHEILAKNSPLIAGTHITRIHLIYHAANYFKHRSQWQSDWQSLDERQERTRNAIASVGAEPMSTGNLRTIARALIGDDYWNVQRFSTDIESWLGSIIIEIRRVACLDGCSP